MILPILSSLLLTPSSCRSSPPEGGFNSAEKIHFSRVTFSWSQSHDNKHHWCFGLSVDSVWVSKRDQNGYLSTTGIVLPWYKKRRKKLDSGQECYFSKGTPHGNLRNEGRKWSSPALFNALLALASLNPFVWNIKPVGVLLPFARDVSPNNYQLLPWGSNIWLLTPKFHHFIKKILSQSMSASSHENVN